MGIAPDVLIRDRYRLLERIAVGSTGEVWRAIDLVLTRHVAVKILHSERLGDQTFRERFRAEARHAAGLSHPGVAEVHDYGEQGDLAFLVMEYLPGQSLEAILDRNQRADSAQSQLALSLEATLEIVAQVARALQAAHDLGLIHRDIKPANLIVGPSGDVKITDFGTARALDASTVTEPGVIVGTAQYLSPEQAAGCALTPATDIYTLGVVAYTCLTGDPPFGGPSPVEIAAAHVHDPPAPLPDVVPPPVRELVEACLAKDPASRPASAAELAGRCVASRAALPKAAPGKEGFRRRRPAPLGAAVAGAALAVGGMLLFGPGQGFFASTPVSANGQQVDLGGDPVHPQPLPGPVGDEDSGSPESAGGPSSGSAAPPSGRGGGNMQPYPAAPAQPSSPSASVQADSTGQTPTARPSMTGESVSPSAAPGTSGAPTPQHTPDPFRTGDPSGTPVPFGTPDGGRTATERGETSPVPSSTSPPRTVDPAESDPPEPRSPAGTPSRSATTSSSEPPTPADTSSTEPPTPAGSVPPAPSSPSESAAGLLPSIAELLDPQSPAGSGG